MQSVNASLSFTEFNRRAQQIVERLKLTEPVAILQYGSSVYEEDYLPGLSDLDLCVISERPLPQIENDLGYQPFTVTPNQFAQRVASGVSFALCALLRGRVLYDPYQFVDGIMSLSNSGLSLSPNSTTVHCCAQSTGNRLSSAYAHYFSEPNRPRRTSNVLLSLRKVAESIAMAHVILLNGKLLTGYTALRAALVATSPVLVNALDYFREILIRDHAKGFPRSANVLISDEDALGAAIVKAESLYVAEGSFLRITLRMKTNDVVENYQRFNGLISRTIAARINDDEQTHVVLGEQNGAYRLFGYWSAEGSVRPINEVVSANDLDSVLKRVQFFR